MIMPRALVSFDSLAGSLKWEACMKAPSRKGLDGRHRDRDGTISRKHGNTKVGTLRKAFGDQFAKGRRSGLLLKTLLQESGATSLDHYLRRHHGSWMRTHRL
jgi:hypothetical protein